MTAIIEFILQEKVLTAVIITVATVVTKYIVKPIMDYVSNRVKFIYQTLEKMQLLVTDFRPNGGGSTWDKIDKTLNLVKSLHDGQTAMLAFTRTVASSIPTAMLTADAEMEVDWVNDLFIEMTGIQLTEALGYGWLNGVHTDDRDWVEGAWRAAMNTERGFIESFRLQHDKTDQVQWVKLRVTPVFNPRNEVLVGWVGTFQRTTPKEP
jgi:PAS domain S-box-containing protein